MLCYRCGGHVKDGAGRCGTCGQPFDPALKAGPAAGFGAGVKRPRPVEGAPCVTGEKIAGRYEVREHVGSGPLGWMYRAHEATNAGDVALKILSSRFLQMAEEKRVFTEELHKAQRLAHPNVARIYEAGEDHGRPFVAAQYLEGLTLKRIMDLRRQKGQRFTLQEVEPIVAQIAAALDAAVAAFAHGNLKPDNVIVLPDLLKLTDFGLAVSLPRAPFMAAQKAAGAHRYLAPEFLLGEPLDARTDVFSLGVMLGEMLSGAHYDAQLSLVGKNAEVPDAVEALFRRAVSPRPNARFANAGDLAAELSELVAGMPRAAQARPSAEDAGDVLIVDAQTDPRLRIARALGATRAPDPAMTPAPPVVAALPDAPPQIPELPPRLEAVLEPLPLPVPLEPAAIAALSALPLQAGPFTPPPPYVPRMLTPAPAIRILPIAVITPESLVAAIAPEPPVAPEIVEPPSAQLLQVAGSVGATPELLTAETAVRPPPLPTESRPRRGAGKRTKGRGRRLGDAAWAISSPPTEAAVAIGPTTSALEPIQPEKPRIETPARRVPPVMKPMAFTAVAPEEKRRSRTPLYAAAIVVIVVIGGGWSVLSSRGNAAAPEATAVPVPAPAKAEPAKEQPKTAAAEQAPVPASVSAKKLEEPKHTMRDRVRAVKDRVDRALEERRRKREEAMATAKAARKTSEPKPAEKEPDPFAGQVIRAAMPATPPPAGAITGVGDDVMLASDRKVAAITASDAAAAAVRELNCPSGMQRVPGGAVAVGSDPADDLRNLSDRPLTRVELKPYCIDQYEFPNQPGKLPKVAATWNEADAQCKNAGKRLCSEEEWEAACRGPQGLRFPYGAKYDADACNTADAKDNARQTTVSGAFSRCKSGYGVADLSGNAAEWTSSLFDAAAADKTVKGGHSARPGVDDRCASRRKLGASQHSINVGFRCCADGR